MTGNGPVLKGANTSGSQKAAHAGAAKSEPEAEASSDKGLDPKTQKAINEAMPLKIEPKFMMKARWVSRLEFPHMIVEHHPKTFRTPATRFPEHAIRTTWVFAKTWHEIEKEVDVRTLDSRVARLDFRCL